MREPMLPLRVLALVAIALALAGCLDSGAAVDPYTAPGLRSPDDGASGGDLYARECAWCHGRDGAGTSRGPNLDGELDGPAYTHFMLASGRMPIDDPGEDALRSEPVFSEEQIASLVDHVAGFGGTGPDVPDPRPLEGDLSNGERLYVAHCAACHSSTGTGGGLPTGIDAPSLLDEQVSPVIVAEAMALGPGCRWPDPACGPDSGVMPRFDFTPRQVDDITRYVEFLQTEGDPGGWNLGRVGPVTEGAAAVVLGGGTVVAALLWIGTRADEERRE